MQLCIAYVLRVDPKVSRMPKMSQIREELRVLEEHKHTYLNSLI